MNSLIIYDSYFGNTEKIAQAVGAALGKGNDKVRVLRVTEFSMEDLEGVDFLIIASPTRGFRPSENITQFFSTLPADVLRGVQAAVFDTRVDLNTIKNKAFRFIVSRGGYANTAIAKSLEKKGAQVLQPLAGFYVDDSEGPVSAGELERAVEWAKEITAGIK